jgi:hypothetical protein
MLARPGENQMQRGGVFTTCGRPKSREIFARSKGGDGILQRSET